MFRTIRGALVLAFSLGTVAGAQAAATPVPQVDIVKVTCGDLLSSQVTDRAAVVMFYWGYDAAKANATTFKTGLLKGATEKLVQYCESHHSATLMDAVKAIGVHPF